MGNQTERLFYVCYSCDCCFFLIRFSLFTESNIMHCLSRYDRKFVAPTTNVSHSISSRLCPVWMILLRFTICANHRSNIHTINVKMLNCIVLFRIESVQSSLLYGKSFANTVISITSVATKKNTVHQSEVNKYFRECARFFHFTFSDVCFWFVEFQKSHSRYVFNFRSQ